MKSANCISATGFIPSIAQPTAAPMIAFSASGVSQTRSAPNSSMNPSVILNAPPNAPMSSPRQNTDSSARISSRRPSEIACRYVISPKGDTPFGPPGLSPGPARLHPRPARPRRLAVAQLRVRVGEHALIGGGWVGHGLLERPRGLALQLVAHRLAQRIRVVARRRELLLVA